MKLIKNLLLGFVVSSILPFLNENLWTYEGEMFWYQYIFLIFLSYVFIAWFIIMIHDPVETKPRNVELKNIESVMVNKQEFIEKTLKWLELETDLGIEYDEEGRNPNYGKLEELEKYLKQ